MERQSELKKAYVNLVALKSNITSAKDVEEKYATIFNTQVTRLSTMGFDVEEFKIPPEEINMAQTSVNYLTGKRTYSRQKYVSRGILLMKLDALLAYFSIVNPETKIGFDPPLKIVSEVTDWVRQTPEELQKWQERLANAKKDIIN